MDVVLISKTAALEVSEKVTLEKRRDRAARELVDIAAALEGIGPVYAPYLRSGDTGADTMAALTRYLDTDNRGRAFVLVTDAALPADLAPLIEADGMRRDRFAGVLMYGETDAGAPVAPALGCTRRRPLELGCTVPVELRREGGKFRIDGHQPLTDGLTDWLEGHASKLAEPLGDLEEIEIIPIQRPPEPG